ncbi:MAG TPA: hypothetical protein VF610_04180, partial [Segetibacter sp.]
MKHLLSLPWLEKAFYSLNCRSNSAFKPFIVLVLSVQFISFLSESVQGQPAYNSTSLYAKATGINFTKVGIGPRANFPTPTSSLFQTTKDITILATLNAPSLGSAANFILYTVTGALGITGDTHLTGDIGA